MKLYAILIAIGTVICCNSTLLMAAEISLHAAYKSLAKTVTDENVEEMLRNANAFVTLVNQKGEKTVRKSIAIPTNTNILTLLTLQESKIAPIANKNYVRLTAATPITVDNLAQMKKDLSVIRAWVAWRKQLEQYDPRQVQKTIIKTKELSQILTQKEEEVASAEKLVALARANTTFADIIVKTKIKDITEPMLATAKSALATFKDLAKTVNKSEASQACTLLQCETLETAIKGMESALNFVLTRAPDALSLVLNEKTN